MLSLANAAKRSSFSKDGNTDHRNSKKKPERHRIINLEMEKEIKQKLRKEDVIKLLKAYFRNPVRFKLLLGELCTGVDLISHFSLKFQYL